MTATPKAPGAARVKPLVWRLTDPSNNTSYRTDCLVGRYYAYLSPESGTRWRSCSDGGFQSGDVLTLEAAQSAAQADYDARILSAMEPAPDAIRAAALEEAAKVCDQFAEKAKRQGRGDFIAHETDAAGIRALITTQEPTT